MNCTRSQSTIKRSTKNMKNRTILNDSFLVTEPHRHQHIIGYPQNTPPLLGGSTQPTSIPFGFERDHRHQCTAVPDPESCPPAKVTDDMICG